MFTTDGSFQGSFPAENAGAIAQYLEFQGHAFVPFAQEIIEFLPESFSSDFDVAIINKFNERIDISALISSETPIINNNTEFIDDLQLGERPIKRVGVENVFVEDNTHPILVGFQNGPISFWSKILSYSLNSKVPDVDSLVTLGSPEQTLVAARRSKPYVWIGMDGMSQAIKYGEAFRIYDQAVKWLCYSERSTWNTLAKLYTAQPTPTDTLPAWAYIHETLTHLPSLTPILTATPGPSLTPTNIQAITATPFEYHIPGIPYFNSTFGFSFEYPLEWSIFQRRSSYLNYPCAFGLVPDNFDVIRENTDYCMGDSAVYVSVYPEDLEEAAKSKYFFYENGNWYTRGTSGIIHPAEIIETRGLFILRGIFLTNYYDTTCKNFIGIREKDVAIISAGKRKSISVSDSSAQFRLHFEYILQTIAFLPDD